MNIHDELSERALARIETLQAQLDNATTARDRAIFFKEIEHQRRILSGVRSAFERHREARASPAEIDDIATAHSVIANGYAEHERLSRLEPTEKNYADIQAVIGRIGQGHADMDAARKAAGLPY